MDRFICVRENGTKHFCLVDGKNDLHKLNVEPNDPADYLALWNHARQAHMTVSEAAAQLLQKAQRLTWSITDLDIAPNPEKAYLDLPYVAPEVWGAAFTYLRGDQTLDTPLIQQRRSTQPVIFFKATPHRYVGPNDAVGSRADANMMIPEPELGLILSATGETIGYTIVNDVSSRDFPKKDPLYVTYSKVFDRCVSYGPYAVAPESIGNPLDLDVTCRVIRGGEILWEETGSTGTIYWSHEELIAHTSAHNPLLDGTLLATGTVLSPPANMHITAGDYLEVEISGIGCLTNPVVIV
jgi:2-dehydro-3-deoxy-D-arabinonate dehydratase